MTKAERKRERYHTDPKYRAKEQQRSRERYQRLKKATLEKTGPKARPPEERFWAKVDKDGPNGCWEWRGASRNKTVPELSIEGRTVPAYRFSYEMHYGPLTSGQWVRSYCRNKVCVNPEHLYLDNLDCLRPEQITSFTTEEAFERQRNASARARAHYQANPEAKKQYVMEYNMRNKIRAINYLGGRCQACGFEHPSALQFHHRDPTTKSFNVTTKELSTPKKRPWDTVIMPELDKCELLCANCHFLYHSGLTAERVDALREEANGTI